MTNVMLANQSVMGALDTAGETYLQTNIRNLVPEELDLAIFSKKIVAQKVVKTHPKCCFRGSWQFSCSLILVTG